jgi:hypothetical protein
MQKSRHVRLAGQPNVGRTPSAPDIFINNYHSIFHWRLSLNIDEAEVFLKGTIRNSIIHNYQLDCWIKKLFDLNDKLSKQIDPYYIQYLYIVVVELVNDGLAFCNDVLSRLQDSKSERIEYIKLLAKELANLLSNFTENEKEFINYRRDAACHIFQNSYENHFEKGKLKTSRKGQNVTDLEEKYFEVLHIHGDEPTFDQYFVRQLYPKIKELYCKILELEERIKRPTTAST